jgi:hypothetical protein
MNLKGERILAPLIVGLAVCVVVNCRKYRPASRTPLKTIKGRRKGVEPVTVLTSK